MVARSLSMSRSGRYVVTRRPDGLDIVDALGTAARRFVACQPVDFACVGAALWVLSGARLERYLLEGLRSLGPAIELDGEPARIEAAGGASAVTAVLSGRWAQLVYAPDGDVQAARVDGPPGSVFPLVGRRVLVARDDLHVVEGGREIARMRRPVAGAVAAAASLFAGRALAVQFAGEPRGRFAVFAAGKGLVHAIEVPAAIGVAIAESRGVALLATAEHRLIAVDLRYGRVSADVEAPFAIDELAIDADGQFVALAGDSGRVIHAPFPELVMVRPSVVAPDPDEPPRAAAPAADAADAHDGEVVVDEPRPAPARVEVPDAVPRALGEPLPPLVVAAAPGDAPPYGSPREHVDELLDIVAALAARAIADGWNSGQLSIPADDARPFQREVLAIVGTSGGYAAELVAEAEQRLRQLTQRAAARATATVAGGRSLPLVELSRELGLSPIATQILLVVVGPQVRGEIARLYGILANDEHRPLVDRFLVEQVIAGSDRRLRAEVAGELAASGALVRHGVVRHGGSLFGALTVDPALVDRLCGLAPDGLRGATRPLSELHVPDAVKRELVLAVTRARTAEAPLRLVLRGRRGSGRHTAMAALAAQVGRKIAPIDAGELSRDHEKLAGLLREQLARAFLRHAVPVVSGLETLDAGDPDARAAIVRVVRAHPGPIVFRATPEATLPLDPGHVSIGFPALTESERAAVWAAELARAGIADVDPDRRSRIEGGGDGSGGGAGGHPRWIDRFAQQFRIAPGVIVQVIADAADALGDDPARAISEAARQHVARRLAHVATRVPRLARWEQVALPEDVLDSLKELISRARHRRTVYERWGFDAKLTTSRGLSALFYGPPGTGKSMVAGLVARELGLELYRVDLARVVSKWVGETEKNLAEIFDAAEDGQVVILFDEADSLFAKRTDVKSSNDRYANLEVNYLLQRLDSFEGVCILTTNLEGSIDPAFKRRMSVRLQFPQPDEETRVRLWAAHVPPEAPTLGDFDFADLARRFPLSGGYIRNSALRAAFLAAQEEQPLAQAHLVRAIQLEYREIGKLSTSGRME